MELTFSWRELQKAFEELDTAQTAKQLYGTDTGKGLWLVGDDGVYLMPNSADGKHHKNNQPPVVIYATECNPKTLPHETWSANKQHTFGGDDSVEYIDAENLRALAEQLRTPPHYLVLSFFTDTFETYFA
jgi:hypothetical protein